MLTSMCIFLRFKGLFITMPALFHLFSIFKFFFSVFFPSPLVSDQDEAELPNNAVGLARPRPSQFQDIEIKNLEKHETVTSTIQYQMQKHANVLQGVLTCTERKAIATFIQLPRDHFHVSPTFKQSYTPQSGEILA